MFRRRLAQPLPAAIFASPPRHIATSLLHQLDQLEDRQDDRHGDEADDASPSTMIMIGSIMP